MQPTSNSWRRGVAAGMVAAALALPAPGRAAETAPPAANAAAGGAKVLHKESTVSKKGSYIRILVNNEPITNFDIARRAKFRQLRRMKGGTAEAEQELIDEKLKLQEARDRGVIANDAQVNAAFENFAKGNKSTPDRMAAQLDQFGVGAAHFKEFIRSQMSWGRAISGKLQAQTRDNAQGKALFEIRKSGGAKPETTEYTLQQIVFVIPADKRAALLKARHAEALAFSQRFSGCENAIGLAKELRDVAVKELGRMMAPELPPAWRDEIVKTEVGKTTQPKDTEKGVELIAVCKSRITSDDRAAQVVSQSQAFDKLDEKGDAAGEEYLAELRKAAVIVYK